MILWLLILWTSLYKRGSLQQQSRAYVQGKAGTQSSYLTFHWSSFVLRISRSPGMWREGSPAEQWDGGYFLTTAQMAPKDHAGPPQASKDVRELHWWGAWDRELLSSSKEPNSAKESPCGGSAGGEALLPKVAADLCSVAASVKHEGLVFRRWEA